MVKLTKKYQLLKNVTFNVEIFPEGAVSCKKDIGFSKFLVSHI